MIPTRIASEDLIKLAQHGVRSEADLTPAKLADLHAQGGHNALNGEGGCSQTFELRHCYWCGKGNCINPAWPVWFCWNGGHPNMG